MRARGSTPTCVRMVSKNPRNMNQGVHVEEGSCLEEEEKLYFDSVNKFSSRRKRKGFWILIIWNVNNYFQEGR